MQTLSGIRLTDQMILNNSRFARALRWLDSRADRPSFLPSLAMFPLVGYLMPLLPTQLLLVAITFLHQSRWFSVALTFLVATSVGAFLTSLLIQTIGNDVLAYLLSISKTAHDVTGFIDAYGVWAIALLALLPWPPRTAVLVCALAGVNPTSIATAVLAGRIAPTFLIAWMSSHAPAGMRRFQRIDQIIDRIEQLRDRDEPRTYRTQNTTDTSTRRNEQ